MPSASDHRPRRLLLGLCIANLICTLILRSILTAIVTGIPTTLLNVFVQSFIDEPISFTVSLDNTESGANYGSYIDLLLPKDHAGGMAGRIAISTQTSTLL